MSYQPPQPSAADQVTRTAAGVSIGIILVPVILCAVGGTVCMGVTLIAMLFGL